MKRIILTGLCMVCLLILLGCGEQSNPVGDVVAQEGETEIVSVPTTIAYSNGSITVQFLWEEDRWLWADDATFPLDNDKVQSLLDTAALLQESMPSEKAEDLSVFGLESPARYLSISYSDGIKELFYFGKQNEEGQWYMRGEQGNDIYLAPQEAGAVTDMSIYEVMLLPALPELTEENIISVAAVQGERRIELHHEDGAWKKGSTLADDSCLIAAQAAMARSLKACVDYTPSSGAWEVCGLAQPQAEIILTYKNTVDVEVEEHIQVGNYRESLTGYYVKYNEDNTIYLIPQENIAPVLALFA